MDSSLNRRRTAMVLHELEQSLGNYILNTEVSLDDFPEEMIKAITARETQRSPLSSLKSPSDIIEATYIDELFNIILEITKDTSVNSYLLNLRELFILYSMYHVRNVISHPNRKFIDSFWYKTAALASDPLIDILGMTSVRKSLISAERNELVDPPDEWLNKTLWEIPNNLPEVFEHAITGLVGRKQEENILLERLKNKRIANIALVAPGGIGKTSLALELLSSKVKQPETKEYIDCCIFATLKTEKLTYEGVQRLDSIESLIELRELIVKEAEKIYDASFTDFAELIKRKETDRVLLFIDNLETLITNSVNEFQDFCNTLPPAWRLLITSRITINNASIITLEPLKEKSALTLSRIYMSRKNIKTLHENVLSNLVKNCHYNPLAIRLSLDLYSSGKEIPDSINVANKEIASFSFSNLIDALSVNAINILECLFISNNLNRTTLCEFLTLSIDEVAESIAQLSNTSLIVRVVNHEGESYSLSESIREILITNPRNVLLRSQLQSDLQKRKTIAKQIEHDQIKNSTPPYHWDYIPSNINEGLKVLITSLNRSFKGFVLPNSRAIELMKKFRDAEYLYSEFSIFNRSYGRLYSALSASGLAKEKFELAMEQDPDDVNAKIFLAMHLHSEQDFLGSNAIYKELMDSGWVNEDQYSHDFTQRIFNGYFLSLLYDHKYQEIIDGSKEWKKLKNSRGLVGVFRATAYKRQAEGIAASEPAHAIDLLSRSMSILDDVIREDGYIKPACDQTKNLFNEIAFALKNKDCISNEKFLKQSISFISMHLSNIVQFVDISHDDEITKLLNKLSTMPARDNPFSKVDTRYLFKNTTADKLDADDISDRGFVVAGISNIPKKKERNSPYIFCSKDGQDYFLHFESLKNGDWSEWCSLNIGQKVAFKVLDDVSRKRGKALNVADIYLLNQQE